MIVHVSVTADDIANGKPGECCGCPVYLAVRRVLPDVSGVGPGRVWLTGGRRPITLPDDAEDFIERYDRGHRVEPFEFDLDVPGELIPASVTP